MLEPEFAFRAELLIADETIGVDLQDRKQESPLRYSFHFAVFHTKIAQRASRTARNAASARQALQGI